MMASKSTSIGTLKKTLIVADVGINHGGDINKTQMLIDACVDSGVDVIKFQTVSADEIYKTDDPLYKIFKNTEFPIDYWKTIKNYVEMYEKEFLSTPGSKKDVDVLDSIGVKRFKIASDSAKDWPFVNYVMSKKKPVIVSTGMVDLSEMKDLLEHKYKHTPEYILHCVSKYPTEQKDANLNRIVQFKKGFIDVMGLNTKIGYSDHVVGYEASLAAVTMGADLIEKHIKLDNNCVDAAVSLTPFEFKEMVQKIRNLEHMMCI